MFFKKKAFKADPASETPVDAMNTKTDSQDVSSIQDPEAQEPPNEDLAQVNTSASEIYPTGAKLAVILCFTFLCMFLVSLDRMIVTTAIPQISDEFKSVTDIGWYGSAFLLTTCACQLLYGKLYSYFSIKVVFLIAVFLFEVGSAICGAAPNSLALILGRAIAGIGGAGVFSGGIMVIVFTVPLHKRPMYQGMFGAVFGVSSVVGPLLGGVFTTEVTWRWCFYINLPIGGVAMIATAIFLHIPDRKETKTPLKQKLAQLDFYGTALIVPGSVCLILAMQWGGSKYAWSEWRMIVLLTFAFALLIAFSLVQVFMPKTATVPPRIFLQRSIFSGALFSFCNGAQMMMMVYYLPIWFQAIRGYSAVGSGIQTLAILMPMVGTSICSGIFIRKVGYYTPVLLTGVCFLCIGAGLLTTLTVHISQAHWVGYQIIYGLGLGCSAQIPNIAAQTVLPKKDVPIGTSLMFFFQLLGGSIFIAVGQNVLNTQLVKKLAHIPGFNPASLQETGATSIVDLPAAIKPAVLVGYNDSLQEVFKVGVIIACISILAAAGMEWKSTKVNEVKKEQKAEAQEEAEKEAEKETIPSDTEEVPEDIEKRVPAEKSEA